MPLLLIDLDNTLVDRASAFRRWASAFCRRTDRPQTHVDWLVECDRDGREPRAVLAEAMAMAMASRFLLGPAAQGELYDQLRRGMVEYVTADPSVLTALDLARSAGWTCVVVTNGPTWQQEEKLRRTGLAAHLDGWVVSESVGFAKPDPRIFRLASSTVGASLDGAWMIGDSPAADVGGGHALGLSTVWLSRGRTWDSDEFAPTAVVATCVEAIKTVVAQGLSTAR